MNPQQKKPENADSQRPTLEQVAAKHNTVSFDLGTPRQYTQDGDWNTSCGCGKHLCSHSGECDCHEKHTIDALTEYITAALEEAAYHTRRKWRRGNTKSIAEYRERIYHNLGIIPPD